MAGKKNTLLPQNHRINIKKIKRRIFCWFGPYSFFFADDKTWSLLINFPITVRNSYLSKVNSLTVIINCLLVQFSNRKLKRNKQGEES